MDNLFIKTLLDWLHVMATVVWIGGMIVNFIIIRPVAFKVLDPATAGQFTQALMKRFKIMVYISIVILGVTGIPLKIINENYVSIINFESDWEIVSFVKHIFYGILTILAVLNFEVFMPKIAKYARERNQEGLKAAQKRLGVAGLMAMLSAIVILVLSSMMRFL